MSTPRIPSYRVHKPSGQAVVSFPIGGGKYDDRYLGPHGSPESRQLYDRLIAEWVAGGRTLPPNGNHAHFRDTTKTLTEILSGYWPYAESFYGAGSNTLYQVRTMLALVRELYGDLPAGEFTGRALRAVRERMIARGWSRPYVNAQTDRVVRVFKWAVSEGMVPQSVVDQLVAVESLRKGRTAAHEQEKIPPVPPGALEPVLAVVAPQVAAMARLQLHTGMRPGEVVLVRPCDLDTSGAVWTFHLDAHKTEATIGAKDVLIGPRGQEVLKPWLDRAPEAYCFSPREALAWWCEQVPGSHRRLGIEAGERYSESSYSRAIRRGCLRADRLAHKKRPDVAPATVLVPQWSPGQIRHSAATELRAEFGIEIARIILGHTNAFTTEIYAEADRKKAIEAIRKVG